MHPNQRKGFIIVVALPLIIAGLMLFARGAEKFYIYFASGKWPVVKASVIDAELFHESKGSRGGSTTGVRGSFSYEYNQQKYVSKHLDITGGSNNNTDDKKARLAILLEAKAQGKQLDAYVNPSDPTYAFIFREISFDMFGYFLIGALSFFLGKWLAKFSRFWPWQPKPSEADQPKK